MEEAKNAFNKLGKTSDAEQMQMEVGETLIRLENFMKEKGMRLMDFFKSIDKDGGGEITVPELEKGLLSLSEPSGAVRALLKRKDDALELNEQNKLERQKIQNELNRKITLANECGAASVLTTLEQAMKAKGLRMTDLFREIDKDGSGTISGEELRFGMKLISEPKEEALAPLRKAKEKLDLQRRKIIEKMMAAQKFEDKVTAAENCGAANVINKLESFLRRKQLRIIDMFRIIDSGGEGTADVTELHAALKVSERSERALRKTRIRATTKLTLFHSKHSFCSLASPMLHYY